MEGVPRPNSSESGDPGAGRAGATTPVKTGSLSGGGKTQKKRGKGWFGGRSRALDDDEDGATPETEKKLTFALNGGVCFAPCVHDCPLACGFIRPIRPHIFVTRR